MEFLSIRSALSLLFVLASRSASAEVEDSTDGPLFLNQTLPYSIFDGDGCVADTKIGTGLTRSFAVLDDSLFCEVDQLQGGGGSSSVLTYNRFTVTKCSDDGIVFVTTHECTYANCTGCDEANPIYAYMNFTLFQDNENGTPLPGQCFGMHFYPVTNDSFIESTSLGDLSESMQNIFTEGTNATSLLFQVFQDPDIAAGAAMYWGMFAEYSCIGHSSNATADDETANDPEEKDGSLSSGSPTGYIDFSDTPLLFTEYGDGPGCVPSTEEFSGATMKVSMIEGEPNVFCEHDIVNMPNGSSVSAYTKFSFQCTPPEEDLPEAVYGAFQFCDEGCATGCSGDIVWAYFNWTETDPTKYQAGECFEWKWDANTNPLKGGNGTKSLSQGLLNAQSGYEYFSNDNTDEDVESYFRFVFENSCIVEGPPQSQSGGTSIVHSVAVGIVSIASVLFLV